MPTPTDPETVINGIVGSKLLLVVIGIAGLLSFIPLLMWQRSREATSKAELLRTLTQELGASVVEPAPGEPVTIKLRGGGAGAGEWTLELVPAKGKGGGGFSRKQGGYTLWQSPQPVPGDNWIALFAPKPKNSVNMPLDHPLLKFAFKMALGEELAETFSRSQPVALPGMAGAGFEAIAHQPEAARALISDRLQVALEQWSLRNPKLPSKLMITLSATGVALQYQGVIDDPRHLREMAGLGGALTSALRK